MLMDNQTTAILENVTLFFLNEQFKGVLEVNEVALLSQSFIQMSADTSGRSRNVRVMNGRRLRTLPKTLRNSDEEMVRLLAERSLLAVLSVDGMISNWTALNETHDDQEVKSDDSISTVLSQDISSNYEEFMIALANESDFFSSASPRTTTSAATESESTSGSPTNLKLVVICGCVVAFVALAGSKFYLERKSKSKRRRRRLKHDDNSEESAYDLSRVTKSGEDQINGEESSSGAENDIEEVETCDEGCACLMPMDLKSPKKAKIDARMTSLLDQVCLLFMVNVTTSHAHPNILLLYCCCCCSTTFYRPILPRLNRTKMKFLHWTCRRSASRLPSNVRRTIFTCSPITKPFRLRRRMESSQTTI